MIKKLLYTGFLLFVALTLFSQEKEMQNADRAFARRNYSAAVKFYKKALRKTNDIRKQQAMAYQIAISYYKMGDYENAETWFADVVGDRSDSLNAYLFYADILSVAKRYEDALSVLKKALAIAPGDTLVLRKIEADKILIRRRYRDTLHIVTKEEALNSDYSDYSLGWWNRKMVFASTRSIRYGQSMDGRTGEGFSKLYYAEKDEETGRWSRAAEMPSRLKTPYNDGAFAFDSANNIAYWTSCNERSRRCVIYKSQFNKYKKQWQRPEKVSFMMDGYNYGHVAVANKGKTLYFVSNMPGGYGGNDIWKISRRKDGDWGIPVNLGPEINTPFDEMFPTLIGDSLLFFASKGHNGYGGLDIFFSGKTGLGFSGLLHLDYPFNSAGDDFSVIMNRKGNRGWFCSNRDLKTGDDIYTFKGFPVKLTVRGTVRHSSDNSPVQGAAVVFKDSRGGVDSLFTNNKGQFVYLPNAFDEYRIKVIKQGFYDEQRSLNTHSKKLLFLPPPQKIIDFYLTKRQYPCGISGIVTRREDGLPMPDVKVSIYNKEGFSTFVTTDSSGKYIFNGLKPNTIYTVKTGSPGYFSESRVCTLPKVNKSEIFNKANGYDMDFKLTRIQKDREIVLSNIYYDFDKAVLRETSKIELNKLASMLRETPGVVVQISAHTDTRGTEDYNLRLSAARAKAVVDYLVSKGVDRTRLIAKGYGESRPLIKNARTEEEHQANRRTTFKVVDMNHRGKIVADTETGKATVKNRLVPGLSYHIQLMTSSRKLNPDADFISLKRKIPEIAIYRIAYGKLYKYEAGETSSLSDARVLRSIIRESGYKDAFIVPYYKNKKISVKEAEKLEKGGSM